MKAPRVIVFDLGKVLLDFDYQRLAKNILGRCSVTLEELLGVVNQSQLLFRYETGLITSEQFFEEVKRASSFCGEFNEFEPIFGDIFTPIPEMIDLHARLRQRGLPTYIFSNTNEMAVRHIRSKYPFFAGFTDYIFSYAHRAMKPDSRIYEVVEDKTGCAGKEILYIDDRLENIEHGRARGWDTIHHASAQDTVKRVDTIFAL